MVGYQVRGYLLVMAVALAISGVAFVIQFFLNSGTTANQYRSRRRQRCSREPGPRHSASKGLGRTVALRYLCAVHERIQLEPERAPLQIMFVRHGEKPGEDGEPHGINHVGKHDKHSLSVRGWMRAGALASLMAHLPLHTHPEATRPQRIIATMPSEEARSRREVDTAEPIARRLDIDVDGGIAHGRESELCVDIVSDPRSTLVVWHHGKMAHLVRSFPVTNRHDIPHHWPDERFDLIWLLTRSAQDVEYTFRSLNQRLLDGDEDTL